MTFENFKYNEETDLNTSTLFLENHCFLITLKVCNKFDNRPETQYNISISVLSNYILINCLSWVHTTSTKFSLHKMCADYQLEMI